jgi:1-acyl-sn-glycerol-3-phosphate acyltransferase
VVVLITFPIGYLLGLVLLALTFPFDRQKHLAHRFLTWWCHHYVRCWPTWRASVTGHHRLPAGPCVMVANHQSMADIPAVMGLGVDFKFVAKAELFALPGLGFIMNRLGYVPIDRGRLASTGLMLQRCAALLDQGERLLIFPEGTYASGPKRLPFRRGAFKLAQDKQVPVVPVLVLGTAELVFEDGPWFEPVGDVRIEILDPIAPPPPDGDLDAWVKGIEARFAELLARQGAATAR